MADVGVVGLIVLLAVFSRMIVLGIAILYHYAVMHKVAGSGSAGGGAKAAALVSILLWITLVFCGIFIAFAPYFGCRDYFAAAGRRQDPSFDFRP